jgi:hypothetical protein
VEIRLRNQISEANRRADKAAQESENQLQKMRDDFERRMRLEKETRRRSVEAKFKGEVRSALKRAADAEASAAKKAERIEKQIEQRLRREITQAVQSAERVNHLKLEKLQAEREKERLRYEAEATRLQGQLDNLSRKLEKQSGERLGEEGELDLLAELERTFPKDRIERVGRGIRGADIIHHVVEGTNTVGRIVYENKNVSITGWNNKFLAQAQKYRSQYETPYVMVVSRAFPNRQKDFCVINVPLDAKDARITGNFTASGGLGNEIQAAILTGQSNLG